jgi:hypothetical protein
VKKNRPVKIFSPDFQKKLILLCLMRLEPLKQERLERDVIQMDAGDLDLKRCHPNGRR